MSTLCDKQPAATIESSLVRNSKSAMFAAVEIHNKPIFPYRYEVCTLLVVNAWELALKAYIAGKMPSVKLVREDGTTKPFPECVACVASDLGKPFEATRHNLEIMYEYRNRVAHFYPDDLDVVVLGLLKCSVLFFTEFIEACFGERIYEEVNLILLPIRFTKPVSPLDFISNRSAAKNCSEGVKSFLQMITRSSEELQAQGISDSVVVNYSMALFNESRIKNADLIAAINNAVPQENLLVVHNVIAGATFTTDPSARQLRLSEETIYSDIFTETYAEVVANARRRFSDFSQDSRFNEIMRQLKVNPNIRKLRLLDPNNPNSSRKDFYHRRIYDELAKFYTSRIGGEASAVPAANAVN
jgi:Protein of unknown function (DUF3644)/EC042_2821-lke REase